MFKEIIQKYGFTQCVIEYDSAYDFGKQVGEKGFLHELGGNPYDPDCVDYDRFNDGYTKATGKAL